MKTSLTLIIVTLLATPIQSLACKLTPATADALQIGAVVNYVGVQAGRQNVRIVSVTINVTY